MQIVREYLRNRCSEIEYVTIPYSNDIKVLRIVIVSSLPLLFLQKNAISLTPLLGGW